MENDLPSIINNNGKEIDRPLIQKVLNITDNVLELKYYETINLIWKVKYDEIPDEI